MTALLELDRARIDGEHGLLVEALTVSSAAERLTLIGDWRAVIGLLTGETRVTSGTAAIAGRQLAGAVAAGAVGLAIGDAPLPPSWTAQRYLETSARLTGSTARVARAQAAAALQALGQSGLGSRHAKTLDPVERRFVLLAHATIGNPPLLVLDRFFVGLDESRQRALREAVERATDARRLVLTTPSLELSLTERTLLDTCDDVIVMEQGAVVAQGRAADLAGAARRYAVHVARHAQAFIELLNQNGIPARAAGPFGLQPDGSGRLILELVDDGPVDRVLDLALDADAPVFELLPL